MVIAQQYTVNTTLKDNTDVVTNCQLTLGESSPIFLSTDLNRTLLVIRSPLLVLY